MRRLTFDTIAGGHGAWVLSWLSWRVGEVSIDRERWQKAGEVETNRLARLQRARESQFGPECSGARPSEFRESTSQ